MTSFEPNDYRVKKANSAYEDRDLSGYATDAGKVVKSEVKIPKKGKVKGYSISMADAAEAENAEVENAEVEDAE